MYQHVLILTFTINSLDCTVSNIQCGVRRVAELCPSVTNTINIYIFYLHYCRKIIIEETYIRVPSKSSQIIKIVQKIKKFNFTKNFRLHLNFTMQIKLCSIYWLLSMYFFICTFESKFSQRRLTTAYLAKLTLVFKNGFQEIPILKAIEQKSNGIRYPFANVNSF